MHLEITGIYASLLGLLLLFLSFRVVNWRRTLSIGLGDGGQEPLLRAQRAQANFIEYVPITLILLAIAELGELPRVALHILGIALVTGRVLHAWGLSQSSGRTFGRFWGTSVTWLVLLILALADLYGALVG